MLYGPTVKVKDLFKYALGGSLLQPRLRHMSEGAWQLWKKNWPKDVFDDGVKLCHHDNSTIEHVVPIEVMYRWLVDNKDKISLLDIENALKRCPVAIILKTEDALLNGAKLTKTMPGKIFDPLSGDPFSRYKVVGIKMHQFKAEPSMQEQQLI